MSLAYAIGKDGHLQVAYEAMDKMSIFKNNNGWWVVYCPCHDNSYLSACFETAQYNCNRHLDDWHSDDD